MEPERAADGGSARVRGGSSGAPPAAFERVPGPAPSAGVAPSTWSGRSRLVVALAASTLLSAAPARAEGPAEASGRSSSAPVIAVYFVDPARAALATHEGRRLQEELQRARAAVEGEVRAREATVHALRRRLEQSGAPADVAAHEAASAALGRFIEVEEARLEGLQDERLAPLLARIEAARSSVASGAAVVLDASVHPPLVPPGPCDASAWLAALVEGAPQRPPPEAAPCRRALALRVDPRAVARALPEVRELGLRLDAFVREKQAALDAHTRALAALPAGPEAARRRLELAERYQTYARELGDRERDAEARVAALVRGRVGELAVQLPLAVFVEHAAGDAPLPLPSCEVSRWLADLLEKGSGVLAGPAPSGCPSFSPERGEVR